MGRLVAGSTPFCNLACQRSVALGHVFMEVLVGFFGGDMEVGAWTSSSLVGSVGFGRSFCRRCGLGTHGSKVFVAGSGFCILDLQSSLPLGGFVGFVHFCSSLILCSLASSLLSFFWFVMGLWLTLLCTKWRLCRIVCPHAIVYPCPYLCDRLAGVFC